MHFWIEPSGYRDLDLAVRSVLTRPMRVSEVLDAVLAIEAPYEVFPPLRHMLLRSRRNQRNLIGSSLRRLIRSGEALYHEGLYRPV